MMAKPDQNPLYKRVSTESLIPYARNSRTHSDAQVTKIAASIKEFGFLNPVIIDGQSGIIAGHGRVLAAKKLGLLELPAIEASHLTDAQRRAYIIADNRLALDAGWDDELLRVEFEDLAEAGFNLELTGFTESDLVSIYLNKEEGKNDADAEWTDMPEFDQPDAQSFRHVLVHFDTQDDAREFFSIIGQSSTDKTKSIWYPEKERKDTESKRYD